MAITQKLSALEHSSFHHWKEKCQTYFGHEFQHQPHTAQRDPQLSHKKMEKPISLGYEKRSKTFFDFIPTIHISGSSLFFCLAFIFRLCPSICPSAPPVHCGESFNENEGTWENLYMYEWIRVWVCATCVHAHVCVRVHVCFAPPDKDASLYPQVLGFFLLMLLLLLSLASSPSFLLFSLVLSPSDWLNVIRPSGKWINQQTEWLPDEWAFQVPHMPLAVNSLDSAFHHKGLSLLIQRRS